jgi:hypothetical protein
MPDGPVSPAQSRTEYLLNTGHCVSAPHTVCETALNTFRCKQVSWSCGRRCRQGALRRDCCGELHMQSAVQEMRRLYAAATVCMYSGSVVPRYTIAA